MHRNRRRVQRTQKGLLNLAGIRAVQRTNSRGLTTPGETPCDVHALNDAVVVDGHHEVGVARRDVLSVFGDDRFRRDPRQLDQSVRTTIEPHENFRGMAEGLTHWN